jgi:hypothetical protein
MEANLLAWRLWNISDRRDRPITMVGLGPIPTMPILELCEAYDATLEDFEKILTLDSLLYKGPKKPDQQKKKPFRKRKK